MDIREGGAGIEALSTLLTSSVNVETATKDSLKLALLGHSKGILGGIGCLNNKYELKRAKKKEIPGRKVPSAKKRCVHSERL